MFDFLDSVDFVDLDECIDKNGNLTSFLLQKVKEAFGVDLILKNDKMLRLILTLINVNKVAIYRIFSYLCIGYNTGIKKGLH